MDKEDPPETEPAAPAQQPVRPAKAPDRGARDEDPRTFVEGLFSGTFDGAKATLVGVVAFLTAASQAWALFEKQWLLSTIAIALALVAVALVALTHRSPKTGAAAIPIRAGAYATLVAVPLLAMVALFLYSYLPRLDGEGNTIAVARFAGPPLPAPYDSCRPSAALVNTLAGVAHTFGHLTAFELPNTIEPNGRWSEALARLNGWTEGADVVIYGDYELHQAGPGGGPQITLSPRAYSVPKIPLAEKSVPLLAWDLPSRSVAIDALCNAAPLATPGFLDDARRLALAVVGARLYALGDTYGAERALDGAKQPQALDAYEGAFCDGSAKTPLCAGILAFYLANLDQRFGHDADAEHEYRYAAGVLTSAAPLIDLGELYMAEGRATDAFAVFDDAVRAEPNSVAALATRSLYERDWGNPAAATVDLDRALRLPRPSVYDEIALARALYERTSPCGVAALGRATARSDFDAPTMIDTLVAYGIWLMPSRPDAAQTVLLRALAISPGHIKANYSLGMLAKRSHPLAARAYFERAADAAANTSEEYLDKANSATELGDTTRALADYGESIRLNSAAVYAFYNRGAIYEAQGNMRAAERDFLASVKLHPYDAQVLSNYAQFLKRTGRAGEAARWSQAANAGAQGRVTADERSSWSAQNCLYEGLDLP